MLVKVKKEFNHKLLKEILPLNYEFDLIVKLSTKPKVIHSGSNLDGSNKGKPIFPRVVAPIGNYEGFSFIGANGLNYEDKTIQQIQGYNYNINDYFEKL